MATSVTRPAVDTILVALRQARKQMGLSIEQLAVQLDSSVATVSRWLRGQGLTLDALDDICRCLGTDLRDLIEAASEPAVEHFSLRQERILANDRELSLIFFLVLNGAQRQVLLADFKFTDTHLDTQNSRLVRLGLVNRSPAGRLRPQVSRTVRWRRNGPLATAFERTVISTLVGQGLNEATTHYVSQLVRIDEAGRQFVHSRFEEIGSDLLRGAAGNEAISGNGEWSALFMMTRAVPIEAMVDWVGRSDSETERD